MVIFTDFLPCVQCCIQFSKTREEYGSQYLVVSVFTLGRNPKIQVVIRPILSSNSVHNRGCCSSASLILVEVEVKVPQVSCFSGDAGESSAAVRDSHGGPQRKWRMSQTVELHLGQQGGVPIQNGSMTAISGAIGRVSMAAANMGSPSDESVGCYGQQVISHLPHKDRVL